MSTSNSEATPISPSRAITNETLQNNRADSGNQEMEEISSLLIQGELAGSELGDSPETQPQLLPSVVFLIPFPPPLVGSRSKNTTPFLMYSPPRRAYERPAKNEEGKRPKEKFCKRIVRCFQKEVRTGEQLKTQEISNEAKAGRIRKARGALIRGASTMSKWLPASCVETLARLPPKHKLGEILVLYPNSSGEAPQGASDLPYQPTIEDLNNDLQVLLRKTRKGVVFRLVAVSCFLPIAAGIDFWAPVFFVEISIAYLAFQIYGLRKLKALTHREKLTKKQMKKAKKARLEKTAHSSPSEATDSGGGQETLVTTPEVAQESYFKPQVADQAIFEPIMDLLYNICARIDPICFPPVESNQTDQIDSVASPQQAGSSSGSNQTLPQKTVLLPSLHKPGTKVVKEMIKAFHEHLPAEVIERYNLDEERLSEDLARYLKKASVEYVTSLNGRPDSGMIQRTRKWFAKRNLIKGERKAKLIVKKQIKAENKAEAALIAAQAEENERLNDHDEQLEAEPPTVTKELNSREKKKLKKQQAKEEKIRKKSEKINTNKGKIPAVA